MLRLFPVVLLLVAGAGNKLAAARDGRALLQQNKGCVGKACACTNLKLSTCTDAKMTTCCWEDPTSQCKAVASSPHTIRTASGQCACNDGWTLGPAPEGGARCLCTELKNNALCPSGVCVTLGTSTNCNACGDACAAPRSCQKQSDGSFACVCPDGMWYCNGACVEADTEDNCGG
ncbi:hypothetical protein HYH03_003132 [Edaphochlamys debaryana]|uniref:Uncharacterized protein n=1 Tax=Edaphochlamys debaryana TaxID=47281 RepID=A0A836C4N9_9CHLO|nr:hypothetical protein HYH03_003132 [Edaphochlamys debaryana]|eukprot:KAG2498942.1 hypothetical protein HYH03_003132 [Edaphochlamys debaryana]